MPIPGARALVPVALAAVMLISSAPSTPAAAASPSEASQVIKIARGHIGARWHYGSIGPSSFDCSGLVIFAYKKAGDLSLIGNAKFRSASAMYRYFRARGKASRTGGVPGDLVIWGNGKHVGIYIGGGKAISALSSGVRVHRVNALSMRFTAFLHTGISQRAKRPVVALVP